MKVLLDTHVLVQAAIEPKRLSQKTLSVMNDKLSELFYSPISLWEIAILISRGRLDVGSSLEDFEARVEKNLMASKLSLRTRHFDVVSTLEYHHRDPFDRLLAAQAACEDLTLLSRDKVFDEYGIERLW